MSLQSVSIFNVFVMFFLLLLLLYYAPASLTHSLSRSLSLSLSLSRYVEMYKLTRMELSLLDQRRKVCCGRQLVTGIDAHAFGWIDESIVKLGRVLELDIVNQPIFHVRDAGAGGQ